MRVFILDDMPERHEGLKRSILKIRPNAEFKSALTYTRGQEILAADEFDLILLDHDLGEYDPANADHSPSSSGHQGEKLF